jgi:hypothetical protein
MTTIIECTAIVAYDPDLPIHMKDGMTMLKKTVKKTGACPLCLDVCGTYFTVCENGCIACKACPEVLNCEDYYFDITRRGNRCKQCKGTPLTKPVYNKAYTEIVKNVVDLDREMLHGLQQIKNHGYVTEGMANGEEAPGWVPIPRDQAIKQAMEFLRNDPTFGKSEEVNKKVDKRSREAHDEEEWEEKKQARAEKAKDRKRKLEEYDGLVYELEQTKKRLKFVEQVCMQQQISIPLNL